jgi:hypothetical protein
MELETCVTSEGVGDSLHDNAKTETSVYCYRYFSEGIQRPRYRRENVKQSLVLYLASYMKECEGHLGVDVGSRRLVPEK